MAMTAEEREPYLEQDHDGRRPGVTMTTDFTGATLQPTAQTAPPHATDPQRVSERLHRDGVELGELDVRTFHPSPQLPRQREDMLDTAQRVPTLQQPGPQAIDIRAIQPGLRLVPDMGRLHPRSTLLRPQKRQPGRGARASPVAFTG
jgi:hypothetical protein